MADDQHVYKIVMRTPRVVEGVPSAIRLKRALKTLGRVFSFTVMQVEQVGTESPTPPVDAPEPPGRTDSR
jgi:hypothetical protein